MNAHCNLDQLNVKIYAYITVCALCFPPGQPRVCRGEDGWPDGGQWAETQCWWRGCHGAGGGANEVCVQGEVNLNSTPPNIFVISHIKLYVHCFLLNNNVFFLMLFQDSSVFCVCAAWRENRCRGRAETRRFWRGQLPVDEPRPSGVSHNPSLTYQIQNRQTSFVIYNREYLKSGILWHP